MVASITVAAVFFADYVCEEKETSVGVSCMRCLSDTTGRSGRGPGMWLRGEAAAVVPTCKVRQAFPHCTAS
jgi:hypothetical protein